MRAAVLREAGKPLVIEEVPDPEPGAEELVLRVRGCGICGSDLHVSEMRGAMPPGTVLGHEFAGEVVEKGGGVGDAWKVGDRVVALPWIACGRCPACLRDDPLRCPQLQGTGLGPVPGGYAEYVRVSAAETLRLPDSIDFQQGATVEPLAVGLHAVHEAQLQPGENVLVVGGGPIGLATALWARALGAREVVVSERAAGRLELAARMGATGGIDASREDVGEAFARLAGGPPDVIFECVGVPGLIQHCLTLAPPRGRIVVVGVCVEQDRFAPYLAVTRELRMCFVLAYGRRDFRLTLDWLQKERIRSAPMITGVVGLDRLPEAFEGLKHPSTQCKVLVEP